MQKNNWVKNILFIIGAFIIGFFFVFALAPNAAATEITFENCQPGTMLGIVRFLEKKTDFEYVKNGQLMDAGSLVLDLKPGDYGVTYKYHNAPLLDADFREITVGVLPFTESFGCEE